MPIMEARLYEAKLAALLHDVGKPLCWATGRPFADHAQLTRTILEPIFGVQMALMAMRHHSSRFYDAEYHPQSDIERAIAISDNIASGSDRPEEAYLRRPRPRPPISLTHPLSNGESIHVNSAAQLGLAIERLKTFLKAETDRFRSDPRSSFKSILKSLYSHELGFIRIPAYTEPPINDHSIADHLRLTSAIATCILLSGGYRGDDYKKYGLALGGGDSNQIGPFISQSRRLPDLVGGSKLVKQATRAAADVIRDRLGPDCVIF